ncbi:VCBS domain-containing protein, partial [Aeromonas sp. sia0103]|uniref:VCBS domain-containing protein n=1 Tax=Aeromonas sp. sia0103 TaxID=2854782 RepID=UPI001C48602D
GTSHTVTITITGVNDGAVIVGDGSGAVTEDLNVVSGNLTETGSLSVTDVDGADEAEFKPGNGTPSANALGSLTIAADGKWSYEV